MNGRSGADRTRVLIMGAAGRDFHDFNVCFRDDPSVDVVAFTAAQIPFIAERTYPGPLAGERLLCASIVATSALRTAMVAGAEADMQVGQHAVDAVDGECGSFDLVGFRVGGTWRCCARARRDRTNGRIRAFPAAPASGRRGLSVTS